MADEHDIPFSCICGMLKGTLCGIKPRNGTHAECFCSDCRAAEIHLGQADPAPKPVGIFQTDPNRVKISAGHDQLAVFSFGEKKLLRWHAACCGAPLFNTMRNPKFAFVGVRTNRLDDTDALGPVIGRGFIPVPDGKPKHEGLRYIVGRMLSRMIRARFTGSWKQTPFFNIKTSEPSRSVTVLQKETRRALLTDAS